MRSWTRRWLPLAAGFVLLGCAATLEGEGPVVVPTRSLEVPEAEALPASGDYVEQLERWRREARLGLGGRVEGVLREPGLAAAEVAHEAAVQSLGRAAREDLLQHRWAVLFGRLGDRFPIDLSWRFDEQFISSRRVLDPASWSLRLVTSEGDTLAPIAVSVLEASSAARDGWWVGQVRLWFPWRHPGSQAPLLGGDTRWVRLDLQHTSGSAALVWRLRGAW